MDLKNILLLHYNKYPKMQLQDAVKLIYQNEFGGGHLISDEAESLKSIHCELLKNNTSGNYYSDAFEICMPKDSDDLSEDIGNGLSRIHLNPVSKTGMELSTINRFFVTTANSVKGTFKSFEQKMSLLASLCKSVQLPFSNTDVISFLEKLKKTHYPPISHSKDYREHYKPSYRIIKKAYISYIQVFKRIDSLLRNCEKVTLAIEGNSGAGKSTLASLISEIYDCNLFHTDHFFLSPEFKTEARLKEPGGNVDYDRFRGEVIGGLKSDAPFSYRIYDCKTDTLSKPVAVEPKKINIIEGCYSMHPSISDCYNLKVFLHINEDIQKKRILKRNGPAMLQRFVNEWIPLENKYFTEFNIIDMCDQVFNSAFIHPG